MSFQRDLTGSSNLYANVILNTNICSSSVSTINLSATNASFTNITTNTWTTGNVSTPNVIATNGYFSNLNVCIFAISNLSTSYFYSPNASIDNLSITSQISAPNASLQTINGATALRVQNNGGLVVKDRDTSDAALIQLNYASTPSIETYGLYLESNKSGTGSYGRIGAGLNSSLQFYSDTVLQAENTSTTGWTFYTSVNASKMNISNLSCSNITATTIGVSTLTITNLSVSSVSAYSVSVASVCASYAYISYIAAKSTFYNLSTDAFGDLYVVAQTYNTSYKTKPAIQSDGTNSSYFVYSFDQGTYTPMSIGVSGASVSNIHVASTVSANIINASTLSSSTANFSSITVSSITNLSVSSLWVSALSVVTQGTSVFGSLTYGANRFFIGSQALANSITFTNNGNARFEISQNGVSSYVPLYVSIANAVAGNFTTMNCSNGNVSTLSASTINTPLVTGTTVSVTNVCVTNACITNLSSTSLTSISANITDFYASNIYSTSFYVSDGNFSIIRSVSVSTTSMNASSLNVRGAFNTSIYSNGMILRNSSINPSTQNMSSPTLIQLNNVLNVGGAPVEGYAMKIQADEKNDVIEISPNVSFCFTHNGTSALEHVRTTGTNRRWNFYSPIFNVCNTCLTNLSATNASMDNLSVTNLTAGSLNFSNASIASISVSVALTATSGTITTLNSTSATIGTITTSTVGASFIDVDGTVFGIDGKFINLELQNSGGNPLYSVTNNNFRMIHNVENSGITEINFNRLNASLMKMTTSQIFLYNPTFSNTSIHVSEGNFSNASITSGTITTLNSTSAFVSNLSVSNFSVATAMTAVSGTLTTLNATSAFVSNLSASNISVPGRISVSNISATSISATGRINGDTIRATTDIQCVLGTITGAGGTFTTIYSSNVYVSNNFSCANISSTQVSSTSIATSWLNASNTSIINASITTLTGTNISGTTANFSTLAVSNPVSNLSISSLWVSALSVVTQGTSVFGSLTYGANRFFIGSQALADRITFSNNGNIRCEISASGVSSYVPFFVSTLNASSMNVCNFNPATITTSTVNACTVNSSNMSGVTKIFSGGLTEMFNDGLYLTNTYASVGGTAYFQMNYWKTSTSALDQGFTMYADQPRGSVLDGGNLPLVIRSSDFAQATNSSIDGWLFQNKINTSFQTNISKLAVSNMSMTGTANISTLYVSNSSIVNISLTSLTADIGNISYLYSSNSSMTNASITNLSVTSATIDTINNTSITNLSVTSALTVPNSVTANTSNISLKLHTLSTNTVSSGIQVPNYIDGLDTGSGLFIGYNHTGGFVNFSRVIRSFENIQMDGNLNQITTTNDLGIGRTQTTGNIIVGDAAMTGNISINTSGSINIGNVSMGGNINFNTTGDAIFGCDRRSTWNTSDLIKNSTQLGSFYQQTNAVTSNKTTTGQTFVFSPNNANTSLTTVPVGLYLVSSAARIRTNAGYNASTTGMNIGICYGNTYNFTSGSTTRNAFASTGNLNTSGTTNFQQVLTFTGVVNMSVTGQYIGAFMSQTAAQAATTGSIDLIIDYCTVVKIA